MRIRSLILALLFFATTVNYLDRAILGVILPEIRERFHFGLEVYGTIQMTFQLTYAAGSLIGGKLLDRYGTRIGYGIAATVWSAAAALNAFAGSALQFGLFRAALGLGEAANFPAANKATAEWFPAEQRAAAMGVVNFGANLATIIGPPIFILIALNLGWQTCFAIMGGVGFLWLPVWSLVWAKFLTDPVWWFYLFWLPTYLTDVRHFSPTQRGAALTIVYAISGIGALGGGVVSSFLIKRGWPVGKARKATMLFCAIVIPVCALGVVVQSDQLAILLFGLATAAHQAWMTNLFTTPGDVFPKQAVGSANGFGVCIGSLGGALFSGLIPGTVIPLVGYVPVLMTMSCFYLVAWFLVHRLMGKWEMLSLPALEPHPLPAPSRA